MSIDQTRVIDLIGIENSTNNVVLTITDHLEWGDNEHLFLLQEKINSYLSFVENGEILESYPKAKDCKIVISVACKHPPDSKGIDFLKKANDIIEGAGFMFRYYTRELED